MSAATIPIIEAIRQLRLLSFSYKGESRVIEPHTYGRDRWRREILCGYQLDGASGAGWRTYVIAEIAALKLDARRFTAPRAEYRRNDGAFVEILAQL